jgi:integrase
LPDTPDNRKLAESRARQIELDILSNNFDTSLAKYRPQSALSQSDAPTIKSKIRLTLKELWEAYTQHRQPQIAETTLKIQYAAVASHIAKLPVQSVNDAFVIRDWLLRHLSSDSARRTVTQLSACCNWAVETGKLASNPFEGMAEKIKIKKAPRPYEDIDPFTRLERDAIVEAFENHPQYNYYAPLVKFCFWTGCRTGEAIALRWRHVSPDCTSITFCESVSTGLKIRKCTKTGRVRKFPCNQRLQQLLLDLRKNRTSGDDLVFPGRQGREMNARSFTQNVWKGGHERPGQTPRAGIVSQLVREGKVARYRTFYNCRHTFISLELEQGVTAVQIAKWVGSSAATILKHYAGVVERILPSET